MKEQWVVAEPHMYQPHLLNVFMWNLSLQETCARTISTKHLPVLLTLYARFSLNRPATIRRSSSIELINNIYAYRVFVDNCTIYCILVIYKV